LAHDLGGRVARQVVFRPHSGSVLLKRFSGLVRTVSVVEREHQEQARRKIAQYGEVTLFGD
jgi:hypothetical protein